MSNNQKYIQESKECKVDYTEFNISKLEISPLVKKEFPPTAETAGTYYVAGIQYNYDTPNGTVKGPLRLRAPRMRAPQGIRLVRNKAQKVTGKSVTFRPLQGREDHKKFMDVLHEIYVKCVQFLNTEKACEVVGVLSKSYTDNLDLARIANPKTRWGGLDHPLFWDKIPAKINPLNNPVFSSPCRREDKTMFLKPFKVCVSCGAHKTCDNPNHRKLPVPLEKDIVDTAGFDGIPVFIIKDIFCGTLHKIRHELETLIVVETECKEAATTEGETIDNLERAGVVDKDAYEERLRLLGGQSVAAPPVEPPVVNENSKQETKSSDSQEENKGLPPANDIETF